MPTDAAPFFDLAEGGFVVAFVRSLSVMALFSAYGTLVFRVAVAPPAFGRMAPELVLAIERRLRHLIRASLAVDAVALIAWLVVVAGTLADAPGLAAAFAAVGPVLSHTVFGHLILLQLAALPMMALILGRGTSVLRSRSAAGLAMLATLLQAGHSHALAMGSGLTLVLVSDGVHLLCAGAWLGGLVPLLLLVQAAPPKAATTAARHFSPLGKLCLYGLVASAACQGWELLGGVPGVIGTGYGWVALTKAVLFVVLFGFAWINRYRLAPALRGADAAGARRTLIRSIAAQTGFGLAVVIAAGILSSLPPGVHTQPIWPFPLRPSLVTIQEDAEFRREVVGAVLALGGAVFVLALGIAVRRLRWPALAAAVVIAGFAIPHLDLLFVVAYPTSFYHSPTGFTATAIVQGAALYPGHCASCHGAEGRGDGAAAQGLPEPPADLTAGHLWDHSDGELFWWLAHGIDVPRGGLAMPGFAADLDEDQRWDLIDYIRGHSAGLARAARDEWSPPLPAPDFTATCAGDRQVRLSDLHGKIVRIVFAGAAPPPLRSETEMVTIAVVPDAAIPTPNAETCVAADPAIAPAYGIVSGLSPAALPGMQFLVDANGWLRRVQPVADPDALLAEIEQICHHPIDNPGGASAHHHHP
jgi:putative copper export protein/mono/diheme cytochrome c family protein